MAKKQETVPKITWQVDGGPIHEIPEGATVTFHTSVGKNTFSIEELEEMFWLTQSE